MKKKSHNFLSVIENIEPIYFITPVIKNGDLSTSLIAFQFKCIKWVNASPFFVVYIKFTKISFNNKAKSIEHFSVERIIVKELTPKPVRKAIELMYSLCLIWQLEKKLQNNLKICVFTIYLF